MPLTRNDAFPFATRIVSLFWAVENGLLGYPAEWAVTLEEEAFRGGKLWRRSS